MKGTFEAETVTTRRSGSQPRRVSALSLYHLAKGRTSWTVNGNGYDLLEGQVLVVLPGQVFGGIESSESVPIRVERVSLRQPGNRSSWTAAFLARLLAIEAEEARALFAALQQVAPTAVKAPAHLRGLFQEIAQQLDTGAALERLHARACFLNLLTGICLVPGGRGQENGNRTSDAEIRVAEFLRDLEHRCDEPWMLEEMASGAGLKRSRFGVICRRLTGESPGTYLNRLRIRRSRSLLLETDRTVTEIAFDCGFSSSQYFAKIFRQFQGHEPTHYRRIARETREGGLHYLKGDSARNVAYAAFEVGEGDFEVTCRLTLDRLGGTAASLEFGPDRFGFDGREGRLFLEGETFGDVHFFQRSGSVIREGVPFEFRLRRRGKFLSVSIDGKIIFEFADKPDRWVGRIGLRPLRNGIHVERFRIDNRNAALK